jgi:hypothetical protein
MMWRPLKGDGMTGHERRWRRTTAGVVMAVVVAASLRGDAQTALRLRGQTRTASGAGVPAAVELDAVYGFRGLEFVGQKTFKVRANDKGQWSVLGVTSGAWVLAAHAPAYLPQVVVLPVQFTQKNPVSAVGGQVPWDVGFELAPRDRHPALAEAADAALAGRRADVARHLAAVFEAGDADILVAAGEIALYTRDPGLARAIFERAVATAPATARAHLGLASAAMFEGAWDRASKALWAAREHGVSPALARAVGAAITELQRIAVAQDGQFGCPAGPGC